MGKKKTRREGEIREERSLVPLLRKLAKTSGVTQKDLASILDIQPSHLNLFFTEKSDIHSRKLISILKVLGIDLEELIVAKLQELEDGSVRCNASSIYAKLIALEDHSREPLLKIIKLIAG